MGIIALVAGTLGITSAVATTIVNVVLGAGTLVTVAGIIASVATGGVGTLMTIGWSAFTAAVKQAAKRGIVAAVAY